MYKHKQPPEVNPRISPHHYHPHVFTPHHVPSPSIQGHLSTTTSALHTMRNSERGISSRRGQDSEYERRISLFFYAVCCLHLHSSPPGRGTHTIRSPHTAQHKPTHVPCSADGGGGNLVGGSFNEMPLIWPKKRGANPSPTQQTLCRGGQ